MSPKLIAALRDVQNLARLGRQVELAAPQLGAILSAVVYPAWASARSWKAKDLAAGLGTIRRLPKA